jgi:carboxyl-terminal processing protease
MEETNKNKIIKQIVDFLPKIIFVGLVFVLGIWVGQNVVLPFGPQRTPTINILNKNAPNQMQVDFKPFWDVWGTLTNDYLDRSKIDPQKLLYGAISGMVSSVGDPYTVFLDPTQNKEFDVVMSGTYDGIGVELDSRDGKLVVIAPISGTPAAKAGVEAGDVILKIDGADASAMSIQDAIQKMRGKAGTKVTLGISRGTQNLEFTITRANIVIKSVNFKDLGGGIGEISISSFGDNTLDEWNSEVSEFLSSSDRKLVLDLRNNPGGRLDYGLEIAGDFVSSGKTLMLEEDSSGNKTPYTAPKDGRLKDIDVVVLINKGSASASEIVSGALRDSRGVKLVGETSFGKGTVQRVDTLPDGSGLHITFAKWLTPSGFWVHGVGLKPDVEVKMTDADTAAGRDPQLDKAKELLK